MSEDELGETARLARGMTTGSPELFERLYERVAASLYAWASIRLDRVGVPGLEPQDVLQEIWFRALSSFTSFDAARSTFRGWLIGIGKHVLLEEYRRRKPVAQVRAETSSATTPLAQFPDAVTSITTRLASDEALQVFLRDVRALDSVDGSILLHHGLEGLTQAETAARLGLSTEVVKKRWQRLCERLRVGGIGERLLLPLGE